MGIDHNPNTDRFDKAIESLPPADLAVGSTISELDARYILLRISEDNPGLERTLKTILEETLREIKNNPDISRDSETHMTVSDDQLKGIIYNAGIRAVASVVVQIGTSLYLGRELEELGQKLAEDNKED